VTTRKQQTCFSQHGQFACVALDEAEDGFNKEEAKSIKRGRGETPQVLVIGIRYHKCDKRSCAASFIDLNAIVVVVAVVCVASFHFGHKIV